MIEIISDAPVGADAEAPATVPLSDALDELMADPLTDVLQEDGKPPRSDIAVERQKVKFKDLEIIRVDKDSNILATLDSDAGKCLIFLMKTLRSIMNNMTWAVVAREVIKFILGA